MSYRPTHRQLEYLVAVGETGRFGEAARLCNVSQPTLSTQVHLLEERLQAKLIERTPGGARPTPLGEIVIKLSRNVMATLDEIRDVAVNANQNLGGKLSLGVAASLGPYFLPHLLPRLNARYPGLELHISEDRPLELQNAIHVGTLDCALAPRPEKGNHLTYRELTVEPMRLGIPADHPLAKCQRILPAMLKGEQILNPAPAHTQMHSKIQAFCQSSGAEMPDEYIGTSLDAVRQLVSIGMGLAFFPEFYIASEFPKEDRVVLRQIVGVTLVRPIGLIWRQGSVRSRQYLQLYEEFKTVLIDWPDDGSRETEN